jgi:transposase
MKAMPWKESSVMDERMRFVIRLKDGESMASLCREFGISRKTGYKIFERYEQCGLEGLTDRARRPFRYANQVPAPVEAAIVTAKKEKPHWGARKIRERLLRKLPHAIKVPAASTIHAVLDRHGLVTRASRPRTPTHGTPLSDGLHPNDLWCADYKGEFQLGDKRYAIRSLSPTMLPACCCCAKRWSPRGKSWHFPPLRTCSGNAAYLGRFARTTEFRSLPLTACFSFPVCPFGGCGWASPSNAFDRAIRSRMAATNVCI